MGTECTAHSPAAADAAAAAAPAAPAVAGASCREIVACRHASGLCTLSS